MDNRTLDPEYTLAWPAQIFSDELRRLIDRGERLGTDDNWYAEVETLLQQAFSSPVPSQDFGRVIARPAPAGYDPAEEPF